MTNKNTSFYLERGLSTIAAVILLQTLYFKFTAAPVSVHIFSTLGIEPWGRIGTGVIELVAGILLLRSKTAIYGAVLALGTMSGAIMSHLLFLGIEVQGDGGSLFMLGIVVMLCCLVVLFIKKDEVISIVSKFVKI